MKHLPFSTTDYALGQNVNYLTTKCSLRPQRYKVKWVTYVTQEGTSRFIQTRQYRWCKDIKQTRCSELIMQPRWDETRIAHRTLVEKPQGKQSLLKDRAGEGWDAKTRRDEGKYVTRTGSCPMVGLGMTDECLIFGCCQWSYFNKTSSTETETKLDPDISHGSLLLEHVHTGPGVHTSHPRNIPAIITSGKELKWQNFTATPPTRVWWMGSSS